MTSSLFTVVVFVVNEIAEALADDQSERAFLLADDLADALSALRAASDSSTQPSEESDAGC